MDCGHKNPFLDFLYVEQHKLIVVFLMDSCKSPIFVPWFFHNSIRFKVNKV